MRATCCVEGCQTTVRSAHAIYCEKHYGQIRRNGYLGPKRQPPQYAEHSHGYLLLYAPNHPLITEGSSRVYDHRAAFYAHFGEGPFHCACCGTELTWDIARVCRHNNDKADNDIGNLETRCHSCVGKKAFEASLTWRDQHHHRYIEWNGEKKLMKEWAKELGITGGALDRRLRTWPLEDALTYGRLERKRAKRALPKRAKEKTPYARKRQPRERGKSEVQLFLETIFTIPETTQCRVWPYSKQKGSATVNHNGTPMRVGRIICERTSDRPYSRSRAMQTCATEGCVNRDHWAWGTATEVERRKSRMGMDNAGANNGRAKLTNEQAAEIRRLAGTDTDISIATRFGVSRATVARIRHGTHWNV